MRYLHVFVLLSLTLSFSAAEAGILPPELDTYRQRGYECYFNMDYQGARSQFDQMIKTAPKHPAGYLYLADTVWTNHMASLRRLQTGIYNRGNSFFAKTEDEVNPVVDKEFRTMVEKGIALAEARVKADENDLEGLYYLGIGKNLVASYEATIKRSFFAALRNGSKGVGFHRKVLEMDPAFLDAGLSVGMYKYVVGSLPFAVKILAFLGGVRGSRKDGLKLLEQVAKDGNYAKGQASALLVMLYEREERYQDSLNVLQDQVARYPQNSIYRLQLGSTLTRLNRFKESFQVFEGLLSDSAAYEYMPDLIHYQYAETLLDATQYSKAYDHYLKAAESSKAPASLATMAHLQAGKCLDALGKREDAKAQYEWVLKHKEAFDSHDLAQQYLKKPFKP